MRIALGFLLIAPSSFIAACGGSSGAGGSGGMASSADTTSATSVTTATGSTTTTAGVTTSATTSPTSGTGGQSCITVTPAYSDKGCLTYASASAICGSASDQKICNFAVSCGVETGGVDQCNINCEQGSSSYCNDATKTQCIIDATCAQDCTKLAACGFIL